jgi:hypothetical protein
MSKETRTVRAKFRCSNIQTNNYGTSQSTVAHFTPVYSNDPNSENKVFGDATPNGRLEMHSTPERLSMFQPGKDYYLDFTPADEEA